MKGVESGLGRELEPRISKEIVQKIWNGWKMVADKGTKVNRKGNMEEGWMKILVGNWWVGVTARDAWEEGEEVSIVRLSREGHWVERRRSGNDR